MVFADLFFIYAFLPAILFLYIIIRNTQARNILLLLFSLFFYAWGEPVYVFLMVINSLMNYFIGLGIGKKKGTGAAKALLAVGAGLNIAVLGLFKYTGLFVSTLNDVFSLDFHVPEIFLPIGISFYTFQTISYIVDIYRGEVEPQRNFAKMLMYVSLFPQLIAGPIVRYKTIADEIDNRRPTVSDISTGITLFIIGLSKKVIVANQISAVVADFLDNDIASLSVVGAWYGIIMFSLQIYFDFSGYSDMAIGIGRIFGFHFTPNFNYPYISKSITDFWRRWHISLGTFFRDYLYIPMGGNRKHAILNIFIVWMLTGLWHGSSWNFMLWGLYFGLLLLFEKKVLMKFHDKIPAVFTHIYSLFFIVFGWAIFYFTDFNRLLSFIKSLFGLNGNALFDQMTQNSFFNNIYIIVIALVFCMPVAKLVGKGYENIMKRNPSKTQLSAVLINTGGILLGIAALLTCTLLLIGETNNPFLYFRF